MFVSALHIMIDFGVGLFDLHGTVSLTEATTLVGVAVIQVWWAISFMAGARGNGSGVASAGILGAGWAALTNGFPIVYCPPVCQEARPLTDLGHVGSIMFGILLALVAIWSLARPGTPRVVHAGRCGGPGGRDHRVAGEHPDHIARLDRTTCRCSDGCGDPRARSGGRSPHHKCSGRVWLDQPPSIPGRFRLCPVWAGRDRRSTGLLRLSRDTVRRSHLRPEAGTR